MKTDLQKILIVDDEPDILEIVGYNLKKENYAVYTAKNGYEALEQAKAIIPDLIILDVMMPGIDGIETCSEMRQIPELKHTIITFLTARNEDYSQIAGFDAGADDFIAKPIKPKVLISRIKALLKRQHQFQESSENLNTVLVFNNLTIDFEKYIVITDGTEITLPRKEFELLALLASNPDKVFTREEIYNKVWGSNIIVGDRTIDVHIRKLRKKLGKDFIRTLKGIGYRFIE